MNGNMSASEAIRIATSELDRWIGQVVAVFNYLEANQPKMNFSDAIGFLHQLHTQFTKQDPLHVDDNRLKQIIIDQCPDFIQFAQAKGILAAAIANNTDNDQKRALQEIIEEMNRVEDAVHQIKYDDSCYHSRTGY